MQEMLPIGNPVFMSNPTGALSTQEYMDLLKNTGMIGFFKANVKAPTRLHIPVLGCINNGKLIFPTGSFRGT
jgi:hypothetical protein